MRKIGQYTISEAVIAESANSKVSKALNAQKQLMAVKEVRVTDLVRTRLNGQSDIIAALKKNENGFVTPLADFLEERMTFFFFVPLAKCSLAKDLLAFEAVSMGEKRALTIFTQVLSGYKFFFKRSVVYKQLNPNNVLNFDGTYKLAIPTAIIEEVPQEPGSAILLSREYLYHSPQQLVFDPALLTAKSDVFSLGCLLFKLLFGTEPWADFALPKDCLFKKDPAKTLKYLSCAYYAFVRGTGLRFPPGHTVDPVLTSVLAGMLAFEEGQRLSFEQLLQHPFLDYFAALAKSGKDHGQMSLLKVRLDKSAYKLPDVGRLVDEIEKRVVQTELKSNFRKKNDKLKNIKDKPSSELSASALSSDPSLLPDKDTETTFQQLSSELDSRSKGLKPTEVSSRPTDLGPMDEDRVLEELERALLDDKGDGSEEEAKRDMSVEELTDWVVTVKRRILLKLVAFDEIKAVVSSAYLFAFRFFLLKGTLFDLLKLENYMVNRPEKFGSASWAQFSAKPVFAKLVNSVVKKISTVVDMVEEYQPKALAAVTLSGQDKQSSIARAVNDDPYDDPTLVVTILLNNLLQSILVPKVLDCKDEAEQVRLAKFALLLKLILTIEDYGKYTPAEKGFEFIEVWDEVAGSKDPKVVMPKFKDWLM